MEYCGIKSSDVVAITATIVAMCALFVSIYQSRLMREHNRLSVKPLLVFHNKVNVKGENICVWIVNAGIGSALIKSLTLIYDDEEYAVPNSTTAELLFSKIGLQISNFSYVMTSIQGSSVLASGDELRIIEFPESGKSGLVHDEISQKLEKVSFRIDYESVYGESFSAFSNK